LATVREINEKLKSLQYKKTILKWLAESLDKNFLRSGGGDALKTLLTDDKVKIPENAFDEIIGQLTTQVKQCDAETNELLGAEIKPDVTPAEESK
jgi:hypothetical protein